MKILVTGGAGFIGSHLVEKLVIKKHKVTVIDNLSTGNIKNLSKVKNKIKFIKQSIVDYGKIEKYFNKQNLIIHLAALADIVPSIENPNKYFQSNVVGTQNILNCCLKYKIKKIIYSASSSCYGIPKKFPTKENSDLNPCYPYALTKKMGEDLIIHYNKVYGINFISLRLFNVYGTRARSSSTYGAMFGVFLSQILRKKQLTVVGNGNQKRDFIFIDDVVNAFYQAIKINPKKNIFNIGYGKPISINKIISLTKYKRKTYIPKRPGEPDVTHANISMAVSHLNWKPKIDISQGVKILMQNIHLWKNAPLWSRKKIQVATKPWFKYLR
tara:strand:- start:1128 stop:2108 length:981 start_codon:yes stop_codon:yes gene_type:complete